MGRKRSEPNEQPEAVEPADETVADEVEPEATEEAPADEATEPVDASAEEQPTEEPESDGDAQPAEPEAAAAPEGEEAEGKPARKAPARKAPKPKAEKKPKTRRPTPRSGERKPIVRAPRPERPRGKQKERRGIVVSSAMDKTIVVRVDSTRPDRRYKKVVRRSRKFHAHDERNEANEGDLVRVVECRPLSKQKRWRLTEILERAR
jgi:small subunit ribosomal protein S17